MRSFAPNNSGRMWSRALKCPQSLPCNHNNRHRKSSQCILNRLMRLKDPWSLGQLSIVRMWTGGCRGQVLCIRFLELFLHSQRRIRFTPCIDNWRLRQKLSWRLQWWRFQEFWVIHQSTTLIRHKSNLWDKKHHPRISFFRMSSSIQTSWYP